MTAVTEEGLRRVDLSFGEDCRGDYALFLEEKHAQRDGYSLDRNVNEIVKSVHGELPPSFGKHFKIEVDEHGDTHLRPLVNTGTVFFRFISNGVEQAGHGWAEGNEIVQWG
jgi:hypothetical protein